MNAAIESNQAKPERLFQGVGIIGGRVTVDDSGKYFIDLEGETFRFQPTNTVRVKLTSHLEAYPDTEVYLKVYPVYNLQLRQLWFTARKFYSNQPEANQINQFLLAGIWQYIPHLTDQPVMSIYRNSLRRGERIESVRTNHLPVLGFDEQVYHQQKSTAANPQKPKFYRLLVRLNPQQQIFEYLSLLFSSEDIPNYIKKKRNKKRKSKPKPKLSLPDPTKRVKQMNFTLLQQTAKKLREAGFFEGKVSGQGITSEALRTKVEDSLSNHPEAVKVLNSK